MSHMADYNLPQPQPTTGADAFKLLPFETDKGPLKLLETGDGIRPARSPWWSLVAAPIGLGMLGIVSALQGTLISPIGWEAISHDLRAIVGAPRDPTPAAFPLLRDTASLLITAFLLLCLPQLTKQWRLIERLWPGLVGPGVVRFTDRDRAALLFAQCNARFRRLGDYSLVVFVGALMLALTLVIGQKASGVFRTFGPFVHPATNRLMAPDEGSLIAYEHWWASVEHPLGFATYVVVATFALYYVCLQNYVGLEFSILALRLRRATEVVPNLRDPEHYGWSEFGLLMRTVANAMALTAAALAVFFVILPGEAFFWLAVPAMLWIVGATVYSGTPAAVLMPAMRRWRRRACRQALPAADPPGSVEIPFEEAQRIDAIYRFVSRVTVLPIRYKVQAAFAYLIPIVLAAYQIGLALTS